MLTERQQQCATLYADGLTEGEISKEIGVDIKQVYQHLWASYKKGGLATSPIPDNMSLDGVSVLHNADGEIKMQWSKAKKDNHKNLEMVAQYLKERVPIKGKIKKPKKIDSTQMLEIPAFDIHMAMLAWERETGANYDTKIARHLYTGAAQILFDAYGFVDEITLIFGGDNQTADNRSFMTERSGNKLDSDSRYPKMAWSTFETCLTLTEMAKKFCNKVRVIVLRGNHDETSAVHLTIELWAAFREDSQVDIDTSVEPHRFWQYGRTVFMATHGDMPEKNVGPYAMNQIIRRGYRDYDQIRVRMGHLHKRSKSTPNGLSEIDGVILERYPTLAAQEAYGVEAGYINHRALSSVLWDEKYGYHGGREVCVGEILDRFPMVD